MALVVTLHIELLGAVGDALDHVEHEELLLREVLGGADVDHPVKDVDECVVVLEKRVGTVCTLMNLFLCKRLRDSRLLESEFTQPLRSKQFCTSETISTMLTAFPRHHSLHPIE